MGPGSGAKNDHKPRACTPTMCRAKEACSAEHPPGMCRAAAAEERGYGPRRRETRKTKQKLVPLSFTFHSSPPALALFAQAPTVPPATCGASALPPLPSAKDARRLSTDSAKEEDAAEAPAAKTAAAAAASADATAPRGTAPLDAAAAAPAPLTAATVASAAAAAAAPAAVASSEGSEGSGAVPAAAVLLCGGESSDCRRGALSADAEADGDAVEAPTLLLLLRLALALALALLVWLACGCAMADCRESTPREVLARCEDMAPLRGPALAEGRVAEG